MTEHIEQVEMRRQDGSRFWSGPLTHLQVKPYIANQRAIGHAYSDIECHPDCPACKEKQ